MVNYCTFISLDNVTESNKRLFAGPELGDYFGSVVSCWPTEQAWKFKFGNAIASTCIFSVLPVSQLLRNMIHQSATRMGFGYQLSLDSNISPNVSPGRRDGSWCPWSFGIPRVRNAAAGALFGGVSSSASFSWGTWCWRSISIDTMCKKTYTNHN